MIRVLSAGPFSSLQDLGRTGHRAIGVPVSGVMDGYSAQLANALVNNSADCAVLEMTYQGVRLLFEQSAVFAVAGAMASITIDGVVQKHQSVVSIQAGSELNIATFTQGARAYLAIAGGFDCPLVLGSRSDCYGITARQRIEKDQYLRFHQAPDRILNRASVTFDHGHFDGHFMDVM